MDLAKKNTIEQLQKQILSLQGMASLPKGSDGKIGLGPIEAAFPNAVFPTAAIHEFICKSVEEAAASEGFIAGLLSKLSKPDSACLWISKSRSIFPPALLTFGLRPEHMIFIQLKHQKEILWAMEEALKCEGISAVIAEIAEIDFGQSLRLQLAVEKSRVTGIILRNASKKIGATACTARWNISHLPSEAIDGLPGVGFPRWRVELLKVKNHLPCVFNVEWNLNQFVSLTDTNIVVLNPFTYQFG